MRWAAQIESPILKISHDRSIFDWLDRDFVDGARVELYSFYFFFPLFTPPARLAVTTILILGERDKQQGGGNRDEGEDSKRVMMRHKT